MKPLGRSEEGSSLAETALLLPVLLLILFGIVEGSRALNAWMVLTHETREAARFGIAGVRDGDSNLITEVTSFVQNDTAAMLSGSPGVTVTTTTDSFGATASVTVAASYTMPMETPFTKAIFPNGVAIHVSSTMRAE